MSYTGQAIAVQPKTTYYKKSSGRGERYVEKHVSEAAAIARGEQLQITGYEWTVEPLGNGAAWQLTAENSYGGGSSVTDPNTPLNDIWELQPNMVEKDLLESDCTIINGLTDVQLKTVRDAVEGRKTAAEIAALTGNTAKVYKLMNAGVKSVRVFQPTLRHTRLVRRDYTIADALTNVGMIYYTASLYSVDSVPSILLFNLPTNSAPSRADNVALAYGWFKKYPSITETGGGKWNLVQEYEYGLWSTDIYSFI